MDYVDDSLLDNFKIIIDKSMMLQKITNYSELLGTSDQHIGISEITEDVQGAKISDHLALRIIQNFKNFPTIVGCRKNSTF